MNQLILVYLLWLLTGAVGAADELPPAFTAIYKVYAKGLSIGESQRQLSFQKDGKGVLEGKTSSSGVFALLRDDSLQERSVFSLVNGKVRPLEYLYDQRGSHKQKYVHVTFDWSKQVAKNTGDTPWEVVLGEDTLDDQIYQIVLMQDLQQGKRQLSYRVADDGKIKVYRPTYLGKELVKTPLGELETLKYERVSADQKRRTTLWCASILHYLPAQIGHWEKGHLVTLVLQSVQGFQ